MNDWMLEASCQYVDPELFFPTPQDPSGSWGGAQAKARAEAVNAAVQVCQSCTVQAECLAYAMSLGVRDGIWGGIDLENPNLIRKRHQAQQRRRSA